MWFTVESKALKFNGWCLQQYSHWDVYIYHMKASQVQIDKTQEIQTHGALGYAREDTWCTAAQFRQSGMQLVRTFRIGPLFDNQILSIRNFLCSGACKHTRTCRYIHLPRAMHMQYHREIGGKSVWPSRSRLQKLYMERAWQWILHYTQSCFKLVASHFGPIYQLSVW
jgi:hypothetical protein